MASRPDHYRTTGGVATLTLLATTVTRRWVEDTLAFGVPYPVLGTLFRLTHGENSGVAFSILRGSPLVPWVTALALAVVGMYLMRQTRYGIGGVGAGLILGGGGANLLDRLDDGRVTDYLDWGIGVWRYATFNLPDTAIVIGFLLTGVLAWRAARRAP